jgi:signal transduction histidine kinase/CheY-like chemotaxis protein
MFKHFDHLFEPLVVLDLKQEIQYFNPSFLNFSKQPPRILRGLKRIDELFVAEGFELKDWMNAGLLKLDLCISPEIKLHHQLTGQLSHVVLRLFPLTLAEGTFVALSLHDLSIETNLFNKYRQQIEELRSTHAQILQADKLATLGEMTATISHEISNPLTIAAGNSELIEVYLEAEDITALQSELIRANKDVRESLERINSIIRNMKQFLWKSEDEKEFCSLTEITQHSLGWLQSSIEEHSIRVETLFRTQDTIMLANKIKVGQVIVNLIKNAIDALAEAKIESPTITLEILRDPQDHQLILNIRDNGPGVPASIRDQLFSPFMTTKKMGEGTGLGLSISKKIMESHQGALSYLAQEAGSCFQMKLPPIEGYSFTRGDKISRGISSKRGPRVIVIDNEPQILNVLTHFLESEGYHVIASANPYDALRFIQKMDLDLIITDLAMPEISGHELSKRIRELKFKGPILYMSTAKNTEIYNQDKETLKIAGMLLKPFSRDEVVQTIKTALARSA